MLILQPPRRVSANPKGGWSSAGSRHDRSPVLAAVKPASRPGPLESALPGRIAIASVARPPHAQYRCRTCLTFRLGSCWSPARAQITSQRLLGSGPVLDADTRAFHRAVFAIGNGNLLGLHALPGTTVSDRLDEHRAGLDHVALGCGDRAELERWKVRLGELGIPHGGIHLHEMARSPSFPPC